MTVSNLLAKAIHVFLEMQALNLHLDLHIVPLEKLYQGLFDHLTLRMQTAFRLYGVNL